MNWNFDNVKPLATTTFITFTIEGLVNGWLRRFAAARGISRSHAMRLLITQAVDYWQKTRQPLDRKTEYPWEEFKQRGMKVRTEGIKLDERIVRGLHEIASISGKTSSRIVSEMLLDAMNAQAEMMRSRKESGTGARLAS